MRAYYKWQQQNRLCVQAHHAVAVRKPIGSIYHIPTDTRRHTSKDRHIYTLQDQTDTMVQCDPSYLRLFIPQFLVTSRWCSDMIFMHSKLAMACIDTNHFAELLWIPRRSSFPQPFCHSPRYRRTWCHALQTYQLQRWLNHWRVLRSMLSFRNIHSGWKKHCSSWTITEL